MRKITSLFIFLLFINIFAFSQEIGKITIDVRATEERVPGDPNWRWYYLTFTSTLPESYTKVQEIIDIWGAQHTSGSFVRTTNGFELKAKYHKNYRNGILILWLNFDGEERPGYGIFKNAAALLMKTYNFQAVGSDDRYSFDYEWMNHMYLEQHGYFRYTKSYTFIGR